MTTATTTTTERRRLTAIRATWLFDGCRNDLMPDPTVILDGATILRVATAGAVPDGAQLIDLAGATLVPGLVDGHVHLAFDSSADPVAALRERDDAEAFVAMTNAARAATWGGVTTIRDLGDRGYLSLGLRQAATTDPTLPHILTAGPPITTPGGHCHFLGVEAAGVHAIRATIRDHAERGVDIIKIMASGGNMTAGSRPDQPQYGLDELRVAVEEAHRWGLPVTAHAHATRAVTDALAAGVDGIEHMSFMTADGVDPIPDEVLTAVARRTITVCLTLGTAEGIGIEPPPGIVAGMPALLANGRKVVASGARVIAGTDAGIGPSKPPDVGRWAMSQFQRLGLTAAEALSTCTALAAAELGLGDRKGHLEPGYDADILAVDGDPLTDPAALHAIRAVFVRGTPIRT